MNRPYDFESQLRRIWLEELAKYVRAETKRRRERIASMIFRYREDRYKKSLGAPPAPSPDDEDGDDSDWQPEYDESLLDEGDLEWLRTGKFPTGGLR